MESKESFLVNKSLVEELLKKPGNVKGTIILSNLEYLKRKGGEKALERLKERIKELEIPLDLEKVEHLKFYPEAISVLIVLLIKEILNLDEKGVFEMGASAMKLSPIVKILTKFFLSLDVILEKAPDYWKEYFDFGRLIVKDYNKEKKYAILQVEGYSFHPLLCFYHAGYFSQVGKVAAGVKNVKIEEVKCTFRGDKVHEYHFTWEEE